MGNLGRNVPAQRSGYDPSIIAGSDAEWLLGGVTFDWSLVTAVSVDTTLPDGRVIRAGQKFLRYGQVVLRITTGAGNVGYFGPYDFAATDGRQTPHRGDIGIVEKTIVQGGSLGLNEVDDVHFGVVVGGHVYKGLVIQSGTGTHSLAAGPNQAELEAALPHLVLQSRT